MNRTFCQTLSELRKARGVNQRVASADLGISQALLSHYENGTREPGLSFVCRACDYFNVSADYLLCRSDEPDAVKTREANLRELIGRLADELHSAETMLTDTEKTHA